MALFLCDLELKQTRKPLKLLWAHNLIETAGLVRHGFTMMVCNVSVANVLLVCWRHATGGQGIILVAIAACKGNKEAPLINYTQ